MSDYNYMTEARAGYYAWGKSSCEHHGTKYVMSFEDLSAEEQAAWCAAARAICECEDGPQP